MAKQIKRIGKLLDLVDNISEDNILALRLEIHKYIDNTLSNTKNTPYIIPDDSDDNPLLRVLKYKLPSPDSILVQALLN